MDGFGKEAVRLDEWTPRRDVEIISPTIEVPEAVNENAVEHVRAHVLTEPFPRRMYSIPLHL